MLREGRWLLAGIAVLVLGAQPCNPTPPCTTDSDGDGVCELSDVCPGADDHVDTDLDGVPDACDACPAALGGDADHDGVCDAIDPCPLDSPDDADSSGTCDSADRYPGDSDIRLDALQVRGTHNSYHVQPLVIFDPSHGYTQAPLPVQLGDQGVRAFEIDIHRHEDGFRVYHLLAVDAISTCYSLVDCLTAIRDWSDAHRDHAPIQIWIEVKDDVGGFPVDDLAPVDTLIRGVFGDDRLFTPDDLQASHASPREAVETAGWPTLAELRGKVLFLLLESGALRDSYTSGGTSLAGRVMFVTADANQFAAPWAVVSKINDPADPDVALAHAARVLVASNSCGAGTATPDCEASRAAGLANGVQMLMDDFPAPVASRPDWLQIPGGTPARCNPVTGTAACTPEGIENLAP
ncbi:MAG: phosphatidylinositol-specific phospholipase C domain-containing protein [bacterium]